MEPANVRAVLPDGGRSRTSPNLSLTVATSTTAIAALIMLTLSIAAVLRGDQAGLMLAAISAVYFVVSVVAFRRGRCEWLTSAFMTCAAILAAIEIANLSLEEFTTLRPPLDALVPASAMAAVVVISATCASVLAVSRGPVVATMGAVLMVATAMAIMAATALLIAAIWPRALSMHATMSNAATHLALPLIVAAFAGAIAAVAAQVSARYATTISAAMSLLGLLLAAAGISLLVRASALQRSERPPLVMPGMLLAALGLSLVPSLIARRWPSERVERLR